MPNVVCLFFQNIFKHPVYEYVVSVVPTELKSANNHTKYENFVTHNSAIHD